MIIMSASPTSNTFLLWKSWTSSCVIYLCKSTASQQKQKMFQITKTHQESKRIKFVEVFVLFLQKVFRRKRQSSGSVLKNGGKSLEWIGIFWESFSSCRKTLRQKRNLQEENKKKKNFLQIIHLLQIWLQAVLF